MIRTAVIKKCKKKDLDDRPRWKQRWCLYDHEGKELLGRHPSKKKALRQERKIQMVKHGDTMPSLLRYKGAVYEAVREADLQVDNPYGWQNPDLPPEQVMEVVDRPGASQGSVFEAGKKAILTYNLNLDDVEQQQVLGKALSLMFGGTAHDYDSYVADLIDWWREEKQRQEDLFQLPEIGPGSSKGPAEASTMSTNEVPKKVKYDGQIYVLAAEDDPFDDSPEVEGPAGDLEGAEDEVDETIEEVGLLDALKESWEVVLDRLPDDLEVDEEFENALNSIDEIISVMEEMHETYSGEGDEGEDEDEDEDEDEAPELEEEDVG